MVAKMIKWYKSPELAIFFSERPSPFLREPAYAKNDIEKKSIKRYPLRNPSPFLCIVFDHLEFKKYSFVVPKMNYDGASIPRLFWWIIGSSTDPFFKIPSLIHDTLCNDHTLVDKNRKLSTEIFRCLLLREGVSKFKANLMCFFVDNFQKTQGW